MKNRFFQLLILLILVLILTRVSAAANYRRSGKFPALKLTYDDISALLDRIHKIIPPPEIQDDRRHARKSVIIGDGKLQVQIDLTDEFQLKKLGRLPSVSFDFSYLFHGQDSKIEDVSIRFSDHERKVYVAGSDPDQVDVLYSYLDGEITKHKIWLGGEKFRITGAVILFAIGLLLIMLPGILSSVSVDLSNKRSCLLFCFGLLIIVAIVFLPYDKWLPGFAIYSESASALVRYSAQISACGVLLGAVSIILCCFFFVHSQTRLSQKEQDGTEQSVQDISGHRVPPVPVKKKKHKKREN